MVGFLWVRCLSGAVSNSVTRHVPQPAALTADGVVGQESVWCHRAAPQAVFPRILEPSCGEAKKLLRGLCLAPFEEMLDIYDNHP